MVLRQLAAVHANGGLLDLEYRMLHQDGQVVWVHDQAAVIRGADGSAECLHGVMLDITARKRAEEAGRASAHALQMLIDASPVAIIEAGVDGRVRLWNPAAERLFGWTAAEVLGRPNPIVPADRAGEFRSAFDRARAGDPWQFETERQRKDGTRLEVLVAVAPIRDAAGALTSIVGLISDVTDQRRAERLLRQREEHFRSLIENAHDIIAVVDPDGILTYISPSVASVMGYAPEAVVGTRCLDWIHADDLPLARERLAGVTSSPDDHRRLTVRARHADGQWRSLEVMARATVDEARLGPVIVNARDVTERLSLEQQLLQAQKMEAIGQLAAGIAHDFNNLLTAILGYGELLRARIDPASGLLTDLDEVLNAGQRAGALTRQLLAIGRQQVLQPQPVDLNTVVTDIGRMLTRVIGEDVTLQTTLSSALGIVNADPGQMQQVLLNLAVNARDAMPGGGTLTIATANVAITEPWTDQNARLEPGRWVCLTVADSGTGMPPEVAAHVFEPFFTTKPPGRGTGLGLSTVYGIVTQSQGRIAISSTPGEGTVVRIYLPEANPGVLPAERPEPRGPDCAGGRETILLVEDDGNIRRLARRALELREYRVIEADSPLAAIECSEDHDQAIDLLVSDVVMPGVNGFDLARTLQAARPGLKAMYISGFAREMHDGRMPPDAIFLQKPFTAESLAQSVRQCLDRAAPAGR
jgi:PAS domain S-box-containing protein